MGKVEDSLVINLVWSRQSNYIGYSTTSVLLIKKGQQRPENKVSKWFAFELRFWNLEEYNILIFSVETL